ncbi:TPA: hypothetical protein ACGCS0_003587, partial [Vibrio cholerae O1]
MRYANASWFSRGEVAPLVNVVAEWPTLAHSNPSLSDCMKKWLMVQGTTSDAGKSVLVAGL